MIKIIHFDVKLNDGLPVSATGFAVVDGATVAVGSVKFGARLKGVPALFAIVAPTYRDALKPDDLKAAWRSSRGIYYCCYDCDGYYLDPGAASVSVVP